jgi:hypothetical protein
MAGASSSLLPGQTEDVLAYLPVSSTTEYGKGHTIYDPDNLSDSTLEEDGSVRMMPFTHALLSQYVGTSREIVTHYMNRFRKQGYMNYSRQGISLNRDTFKTILERTGYASAVD